MASRSLGTLTLDLAVKTGMFVTGMNKAERAMGTSARSIEQRAYKMGQAIGTALKVGAGVAAAGLGIYIKNTIEAEKVQAQLLARIKDTGAAAGRSIQQLNTQAEKLQSLTIFDDETIGGAQAMLLTFKQVQGLQFDKAIESALDLATVMGTDATSAAKLLGKALADPEKGMAALSRAGVVFTAAEREVIKSLAEAGEAAKAQDLILAKLQGSMGSAAEAARNTLGGALQGLKNAFDNLLEGDSGSDGVRGTVAAINDLTAVVNSPDVRAGMDSIASGIANITAQTLQGVGALARFQQGLTTISGISDKRAAGAAPSEFSDRELTASIALLSRGKAKAKRDGNTELYNKLQDEITRLLRENTKRIKGELATKGVDSAFDFIMQPLPAAAPKLNTPKPPSIRGLSRSGGSSRAAATPALPDYMAKDREALAEAIEREAVMVERANTAYLDMAASYGGPLAEAQREHIKNLAEIAEVGKAAMRTPEEIKALTDAEVARYDANVEGIEGMSAAMEEQKAFMDGIRGTFDNFFMDVFTGTKSIKDAFNDLFDGIAEMITQKIVNGWMDKLFGAPGTTGAGTSGGGFFASLLGMFGFGGANANGNAFAGGNVVPFANGGVVSAPQFFPMAGGRAGLMGEAGPEAIMPLARVNGKLGVRMSGNRGGIVQNITVQGRPDKSTLRQIERASGRGASREMARTGR